MKNKPDKKNDISKEELYSSNYNIITTINNSSDYDIIVHGYTGAIDLVSKDVAKSLKLGDLVNINEETIINLKKRGYITSKTLEEEKLVVRTISETIKKSRKKFTFMFAVTYGCNFRCPYCFQTNEDAITGKSSSITFTKQMVDIAYDAMLKIEPERKHHSNTIILYGGEPLLKENELIVNYLIDEGVKRGYKFVATTNGYDLKYFVNILHQNKISEIQVTIDGIKERHNTMRLHYKEKSTYDAILENIEIALSKNIIVRLRLHINESNSHELTELINELKNRKLFDNPNFKPYTALLKDFGCTDNKIPFMSKVDFAEFYFETKKTYKTADNLGCNEMKTRNIISNALKNDSEIIFNPVYCSAHNNMIIFDPLGDLYSCWETLQMKNGKIGTYIPDVHINEERYNKWQSRIVSNLKQCSKCKYALFCGGGCAGALANKGVDIDNSNCDEFPKLFNSIINNIYNTEIVEKLNS